MFRIFFTKMVQNKVGLLMISKTKLYSSLPDEKFHMKYYSEPHRHDINSKGVDF